MTKEEQKELEALRKSNKHLCDAVAYFGLALGDLKKAVLGHDIAYLRGLSYKREQKAEQSFNLADVIMSQLTERNHEADQNAS